MVFNYDSTFFPSSLKANEEGENVVVELNGGLHEVEYSLDTLKVKIDLRKKNPYIIIL